MTTSSHTTDHFAAITTARSNLNNTIQYTPCIESPALSELTGVRVFCKQEFLQRTGSFKERGARNALVHLSPQQAARGVIAASAGNHALGLSWHGRLLQIPVTVVMPRFAPLVKVVRCQQFGARVILHGDTLDGAREEADRLAAEEELTYIHPFDDPLVIAGQGTVALEIVEQVPDADAVIIPIGGGGLIAGMATVFHQLKPSLKVYGVEPARAASYTAALKHKQPYRVENRFTVADGLAVSAIGHHPFVRTQGLITRVVTVQEEELALSILRLAELEKCIIEGAGAAGLAALISGQLEELQGKRVVLLLTGGNIDPLAHSRVIERGLAADGRIYRFDALIADRPGALAHLSALLAEVGVNVTEVVHNRTFAGPDLSRVHVLCTVETRDRAHIDELRRRLQTEGVELFVKN